MMELLTMQGPHFLLLFLFLIFMACLMVDGVGKPAIAVDGDLVRIRDPYLIAYLRGELDELIRVVTLSLTLRGLLKIDSKGIQVADPSEIERVQVPIEQVILAACRGRATPVLIEANSGVRGVGQEYRRQLVGAGLLLDDSALQTRWYAMWVAIVLLSVLAIAKIIVALNTGHSNVLFLIVAVILSDIGLLSLGRRRLTRRGAATLKDLATLFAALKARREPLPATAISEATLLAAVFGVYSLMGIDRDAWARMFVRINTSTPGGAGGCGGGGCGSGGGGCSGGGGGGCGGCGGH